MEVRCKEQSSKSFSFHNVDYFYIRFTFNILHTRSLYFPSFNNVGLFVEVEKDKAPFIKILNIKAVTAIADTIKQDDVLKII